MSRALPTIPMLVTLIALGGTPLLAQPESDPEPVEVPSLDELLGTVEDSETESRSEELDRALSAQEAGERFQQAVTLMDDAAVRIAEDSDLGLPTQRIQEDIIRKLDQVIEAAQQQGGGGGGSSSGESGNEPQQAPDQTSQQGQSQAGSESESESMAPGLQGVQLAPGVAPDGVTWGNLPERARDAVSQGVADRYSALYRRLTELYYRRLAEQEGEQ